MSSVSRPAISRPRNVRGTTLIRERTLIGWAWSAGRLQDVADAADGVDERSATRVDLLAQVADVELDHVGLAAEVVVPHPVEDLRLRQHPPGVAHHEPQQLELGRGEVDKRAGAADPASVLFHGQVAPPGPPLAAGLGEVGSAQQPAQTGEDLLEAEWLGQVVIAA